MSCNQIKSYYVYVYIDPRNYEEFYYGKGKDSRKEDHLKDTSDTEKAKRIRAIKNEGLTPIIRVIAKGLSEHDALLVEKTLLWKLGNQLTNISSGHYESNFRPHNTLHKQLNEFDYTTGIYYYNTGSPWRDWEDYKKYHFISAGNGVRYRDAISSFKEGDIIAAYISGHGYVGIGKIIKTAIPIRDFKIGSELLINQNLNAKDYLIDALNSDENCEYVAEVEWLETVKKEQAKWKSGLFASQQVKASLDNQQPTIRFLEKEFNINLYKLLGKYKGYPQ
jgi:hypothetical protein